MTTIIPIIIIIRFKKIIVYIRSDKMIIHISSVFIKIDTINLVLKKLIFFPPREMFCFLCMKNRWCVLNHYWSFLDRTTELDGKVW